MINEVYQMCLALLNKNNYGYMTPMEFNLFAEQAQLDIFEDLFIDYNMQITKRAGRRSDTGYPDIAKGVEESISIFSNTVGLQNLDQGELGWNAGALPAVNNLYKLPYDYYFINKLFYCPTPIITVIPGEVTGVPGVSYDLRGNWIQTNTPLPTWTASTGDYVINLLPDGDPRTEYPISTVMGEYTQGIDTLTVSNNIFWANGITFPSFRVYSKTKITEIEKVSQKRIFNLTNSNLTAPTSQYPAYVLRGDKTSGNQSAEVYPITTINENGMVFCQYIRYPLTPRWSFTTVGTRAVFNQTALDYQDFELPQDNFQDLVARILQYGGLTIREVQAVQYGQALEKDESTEEMTK